MYLPMLANLVEFEPGVLEEGNLRSRVLAVYLSDFSGVPRCAVVTEAVRKVDFPE